MFLKKLENMAKTLLSAKTHQKWVVNITEHFEERFLLRNEGPRLNLELSDRAKEYLMLDDEEKIARAVASLAKSANIGKNKKVFQFRDGKTIVDEITIVFEKAGQNAITLITWYRPGLEDAC